MKKFPRSTKISKSDKKNKVMVHKFILKNFLLVIGSWERHFITEHGTCGMKEFRTIFGRFRHNTKKNNHNNKLLLLYGDKKNSFLIYIPGISKLLNKRVFALDIGIR